jgi:hypothetical protein
MTTSTLTLRSPAELIAAVPYLLGFHPQDSLVVVAFRGRRVLLAARHDRPPPGERPALLAQIAKVMARENPSGVTLVGYGPPEHMDVLMVLAASAMHEADVRVLDVIRVHDGQFASYLCHEPGCCPSPVPPPDSPIAAAATYAGQVALADRAELVAQVAPVDGPDRERMVAATERAQQRVTDLFGDGRLIRASVRRAGRHAVREAERRCRAGRSLTDDEVAWLGLTLIETTVRDYAWERIGTEEWHLTLWCDVLRRVEPGYVPAPAGLAAWAAWRSGTGALAWAAVDRGRAHDPEYLMVDQIAQLLRTGMSPATFPDFRPAVPVEVRP